MGTIFSFKQNFSCSVPSLPFATLTFSCCEQLVWCYGKINEATNQDTSTLPKNRGCPGQIMTFGHSKSKRHFCVVL